MPHIFRRKWHAVWVALLYHTKCIGGLTSAMVAYDLIQVASSYIPFSEIKATTFEHIKCSLQNCTASKEQLINGM